MNKARRRRLPRSACLHCGKAFEPTRYWQRYHSIQCRRAHYWVRIRESVRAELLAEMGQSSKGGKAA